MPELVTRKSILSAAEQCVCHDRNDQYGTPENSFQVIANLWEDYLLAKYRRPVEITAGDVGNMLALMKIGRIATGKPKLDNYIDLAGYAACGGEIDCGGDAIER